MRDEAETGRHDIMRGKTMNRRLIATLLSAACAVAPLALVPADGAHAQSVSRPANDIVLSIGRGQLVTVPGKMSDVFVADEKIADVQVRNANQLYVFGKGDGIVIGPVVRVTRGKETTVVSVGGK